MSEITEQSDKNEITQTRVEDEEHNDSSMFNKLMKLPNAVILHRTEEMLEELALRAESTEHTIRERKRLEKLTENMTAEAIKTRIRRKKTVNEVKDYCKKLEDAQALYNSLVEPFNGFEISRRVNARTLSEASYRLKSNEKIFDEMCEERKKHELKMQNMLADKRNEFESKKSILNNMKEKLEQKKLSIQLKMEKRDKLKNEVQNLKVEDQIIELNNCKAKAAETKRFLNDVDLGCKENDLKIRDKSQEVHETKLHLKSMKNEIEEKKMAKEILEQRIKNEKTLVLQCIQTTMNQEWIKVEQANLNIATELSILMKKKEDYDILMQEMEERNKAFVQDRENIVQQQAHVLMEVEEMRRKVSCIPIINPAFVHKIEGLKKKIADSKERKLKQDAIYNETHIEYENTLQGLINQQKQILGIASSVNYESDQSNTSSSPFFKSMSQTSDIQLIEKVDVTVMSNATASSFSPYTSAVKSNRAQTKNKKK